MDNNFMNKKTRKAIRKANISMAICFVCMCISIACLIIHLI